MWSFNTSSIQPRQRPVWLERAKDGPRPRIEAGAKFERQALPHTRGEYRPTPVILSA